MLRKILIALAVLVLLLLSAGVYVEHVSEHFLQQQAKARPEPALIKGEGLFQKRLFYTGEGLGNISQILVGWPADREGATIAVVGNKGAHFLDLNGRAKKRIAFAPRLFCPMELARVNANGDYAYLTRDESWSSPATLLDSEGRVSWTYAGGAQSFNFLSAVHDSVSGDIYGDGSLSVVVGLNGGGGLALLDKQGKTIWKKSEANVWHVETLDTNGDGREEILHSNARGELLVRDAKGEVIAHYLPGHYISGFTITCWGEEQHAGHILIPSRQNPERASTPMFIVLDASGKTVAQLDSPLGDSLREIRATPVRFGKGIDYFAVLQNSSAWQRSMLLLYGKYDELVYQEIFGESCLGMAAIAEKDTEELLVGCAGKIWAFSPILRPDNLIARSSSKP